MRGFSVKLRLSAWVTVLMSLLAVLLLGFMLSLSSQVAAQTSMSQLSQAMRDNISQVGLSGGKLELGEDFHFYRGGVVCLIYSRSEALLAGQVPVSFAAGEPFQNGVSRVVYSDGEGYLILDYWIPIGWSDGVWMRGIMEVPENHQFTRNILILAFIAMPVFILLTAFGSYRIVRRAFGPLEDIIAAAGAINEASDLSRRIGLPPGRDEFSRLAATFDGLFERLERSFEAEKQFAADASHELRTPVSIIKGACEYAEKYDETPEERRETIDMIHRQATRMSALIAQLLSMTRLEQGTERASMEQVELCGLISSVCAEQPYDGERLILELPESLTARGDYALLSRLVRNLVENAFKYGKPQGHVWVSARRDRGEVLIQVRDDGIGISPEQQEKVWQRFYQADPSRSEEGGAGLGLSLVRQIAQLHGGYMTLESIPGIGSSFTFHLPAEAEK